MKWDYEGKYLEQFDPNFRGIIGHRFCQAVREGCDWPKAILDWMSAYLAGTTHPVWQAVGATCNRHDAEAWDFAQHILDRESLSPEEKYALKTASKATDFWHGDKPTVKQLNYLKALGCDVVPNTKLEASELIEHFKASRKPKPVYDPDAELPF